MDPNILTKDGWTALHIATLSGNSEIVESLLKDPRTQIDLATDKGTALHCACYKGSIHIVKMLLLNRANFLTRDCFGKLAKEVTSDSRIVSLFERYEKMSNSPDHKEKSDLYLDEVRESDHWPVSPRE